MVWTNSGALDDLITYTRARAVAKKTFRRKKRERFRAFAGTINLQTDSSYVW